MRPTLRRGFTLIETLVVVAIIGVLAGLLLPVIMHVPRRAKVMRARREVKELDEAWKAYLVTYKRFPDIPITKMDSNALAILRDDPGGHTNAILYNPRSVPFLDIRRDTLYYCDPWGVPNTTYGVYNVRLDTNLQNYIQFRMGPGGPTITVGSHVAVWSNGPDGIPGTADDICSWKD